VFRDVLAKIQDRVLEVVWSKRMSNEVQVDSTPLSSYALVKRAGTGAMLPGSCFYTFRAVPCRSAVAVKMSNTITNEEHADMIFVY
jgi:hypothetical protein